VHSIRIGDKEIGDGNPCYFVAEIGGLFKNFDEGKRLIDSAIDIGIDAIKFQTLEAETITTKSNYFHLEVTGKISQYDFFKQFEPTKELQKQIVEYAKDKGVTIFSAPSHIKDLEIMKELELPAYKIGSDLAHHIPLLIEVARTGKPIILSTGMCNLEEIRESVHAILAAGNDQLILLHCVSDYPAKIEESNLMAIPTMKKEFDVPVGYSDHTLGINTSFAAAILGANIVEKHFKHPSNQSAPDDIHAITPEEFSKLIQNTRDAEKSKGNGIKIPTESEKKNMVENRVSIISMKNIPKGTTITKDMIDIRRPGTGLAPKFFDEVIGRKAKENIPMESPITWNILD